MSVYELAKKYYPKLWDRKRILTLYEAGKLTKAQAEEILNEVISDG